MGKTAKPLNEKKILDMNPQVNLEIFRKNQAKIAEIKAGLGPNDPAAQVAPAYGGKRTIRDDRGFVSASENWRAPVEA